MRKFLLLIITFIVLFEVCLSFTGGEIFLNTRISERSKRTCFVMSSTLPFDKLSENIINDLNHEFSLKLTDYTISCHKSIDMTWSSPNGYSGVSQWLDETKGSKFTGVSHCITNTPDGWNIQSVNVWMGPTVLTPHMTLSVHNKIDSPSRLILDYIPRGSQPLGSDSTFFNKFYNNKEYLETYQNILSSESVTKFDKSSNIFGRLLQSPMHISVANVSPETAYNNAYRHALRFISWVKEAPIVEPRQRALVNTRDDKLRQFAFQSNLHAAMEIFPTVSEAQTLAAAWTGPLAEAYIGGGS